MQGVTDSIFSAPMSRIRDYLLFPGLAVLLVLAAAVLHAREPFPDGTTQPYPAITAPAPAQPGLGDSLRATAREDGSFAEALSLSRRRIHQLKPEEQAVPGNEGVLFYAWNPGQSLEARFGHGKVRIRSARRTGWEAEVRFLTASGSSGPFVECAHGEGTQVACDHDAGIQEWYRNREDGMEHGLTLFRRPHEAAASGEAVLRFSVSGLEVMLAEEGTSLEWRTANTGQAVVRYSGLNVWDASGQVLPATMGPAPGGFVIRVQDAGAQYPVTVDPIITDLEGVIDPPFYVPPFATGTGLAISGTTMLSGTRVLKKAGDFWMQEAVLDPQTPETVLGVGNAVALDGDTAVIGAQGSPDVRGMVFVFARTGTTWTQQAALTAQGGHIGDYFGASVSVSGDTIVAGASNLNSGAGTRSGAAFVFTRSGSVWSQQARLVPTDTAAGDYFGNSVGIHGDTVVVGAPAKTTAGTRTGVAYIFRRTGAVWTQQARLTASDAATNESFGTAVAVSSSGVLVGDPSKKSGSTTVGAAYHFVQSGVAWSELKKFQGSASAGFFGSSVALEDNDAVFGSPGVQSAYVGGTWTAGRISTSRMVNGVWGSLNTMPSPYQVLGSGTSFGNRVALDGSILVVGSYTGPIHWYENLTDRRPVNPVTGAAKFTGTVALSGSTTAVAAPTEPTVTDQTGTVHILIRDGGIWKPQVRITEPFTNSGALNFDTANFGSGVALDGQWLAVRRNWTRGTGPSAVRSYNIEFYSSSLQGWEHRGGISNVSGTEGLSLSGDTFVRGKMVYTWNGTNWVLEATLPLAASEDVVGVAIEGDRILAGTTTARAVLFERTGTTWAETAQFTMPDAVNIQYARAVALSGDVVAIGAPGCDTFGTDAGCVFASVRSGAGWGRQLCLGAQGSAALGSVLAADGNIIAAGSPTEAGAAGAGVGAVHLFGRIGSQWRSQARVTAPLGMIQDNFGSAIAFSGGTLLAVASRGDAVNPGTGQVVTDVGTVHDYSIYTGDSIMVEGNGSEILPGETRALAGNHTWFGSPATSGGGVVRTFTIRNAGDAGLLLTGSPLVRVTGPHAADFTVTQPAGSTIAPRGTKTFQVSFRPGGTGWRSAQISIASSDTDVPLFQFQVQGVSANALTAGFSAAGVSAFEAASPNVRGLSIQLSLTHTPDPGAELTVLRNTGLDFIEGEFSNLAQGQEVALFHGKRTYRFVADYFGGDGNDLVLVWKYRRLFGWGSNTYSNAGDGQIAASKPVPGPATSVEAFAAANGKFIKDVKAGYSHALVLFIDGTVAAWGQPGGHGVLGTGNTDTTVIKTPAWVDDTGVLAGRRVVQISAGQLANLALCADHTLASWGYNLNGQLGDGTLINRSRPVESHAYPVAGRTDQRVVSVVAGDNHSTVLHANGKVSSAGHNVHSGTGLSTVYAPSFWPVSTDPVRSAMAGREGVALHYGTICTAVLTKDGTICYWGVRLNPSPWLISAVPADAASGSLLAGRSVRSITPGYQGGLALTGDGAVISWEIPADYATPVTRQIGGGPGSVLAGRIVTAVSTSGPVRGHSVAVLSDGTVATWGTNTYGQLGDGTLTARPEPVLLGPGILGPGERFASAWTTGEFYSNPVTFAFVAAPPPPQIQVTGKGQTIADGDTTPQAGDGTDFGPVAIVGGTASIVFTVSNSGAGNLQLTGSSRVAVSGPHAPEFLVTRQPAALLPANGGSTTFEVRFAPQREGLRRATLEIASDEGNGRTLRFDIAGTGIAGNVIVEEPAGTGCLPGGTRDFGTVRLGDLAQKTFTLRNTGTGTLFGLRAVVEGGAAGSFSITASPPASLAPGQSATLGVGFVPQWEGALTTVLKIDSTDPDGNPFEVRLQGTGGLPELSVTGPGGNVLWSGSEVDMGVAKTGFSAGTRSFTLRNDGQAALGGLAVRLTEVSGTEFTLDTAGMTASLAPGASTAFRVGFRPSGALVRRAGLVIESNDPDNNPFTLALRGMGLNVTAFLSVSRVGDGPGGETRSEGHGLSGTGDVVAGVTGGAAGDQGFRWTRTGGMVLMPVSGVSRAFGISRDGTTVAGEVVTATATEAVRWTQAGVQTLTSAPGVNVRGAARSVSADGTVVSGSVTGTSGAGVMRWSGDGGLGVIGFLPGGTGSAAALAMSDDGTAIAGYSATGTHSREAFRWTAAGGIQGLGFVFFLGAASEVRAMSADGQIMAGSNDAWLGTVATRWNTAGGTLALGDLPGGAFASAAAAVTGDGAFIAGWGTAADGRRPVLWHQATGLLDLRELIERGGGNLAGWSDLRAAGISDNGDAVLLNGINPEGNPEALLVRGLNSAFTLSGSFAAAAAVAGLSGAAAGPLAAPKGDGVANLLKYAFNMDLGAADRRVLTPGSGVAGLPYVSVVSGPAGRRLRVEYVRRKSGGLTYTAQRSSALTAAWTTITAAPAVTSLGSEWERVILEEPVSGTRWFGRVSVALP